MFLGPFVSQDDNAMRDLGVSSVGARLRLRMLAGTLKTPQGMGGPLDM